jgi:hypothetical protein
MLGSPTPLCKEGYVAVQIGAVSGEPLWACYHQTEIDCYNITQQVMTNPNLAQEGAGPGFSALAVGEYIANHMFVLDVCSRVERTGDRDSVDMPLVRGQEAVSIECNGSEGCDVDIYVTGPSGEYLGGSFSNDDDESLTIDVPTTGGYTAHVYSWEGKGPFDLRVSLPDTVLGETNSLSQGRWSYRWVNVDALQPAVTLRGPDDADFDLYVFDSNGRYVAGSWSYTSVEQVKNFTNYCGRFLVGVHAYRGSGSYVLTCNTRWQP